MKEEILIEEIIAEAIKNQKELDVTMYTPWEGFQTETLQPLVSGNDAMGFPFAWGYLPEKDCFYKFYVDLINEAVETGRSYKVPKDVVYHDNCGENIMARADVLAMA